MIILNFPENPTGGLLTEENLEGIADKVKDRQDLIILSDEIYSRIIYDGKHRSIASLPGMKSKTTIIDGFSKTYAMTGWRLGYGVMRQDMAEKISQLMMNSNSCTSAFTQMAGIEALTGPQEEVDKMVDEFKQRRDVIIDGLNRIEGITCKKPQATFYAFPNIQDLHMTSQALTDLLLNEAGVAALSGTSFGSNGEGYLRFSFANSIANIEKALVRIKETVENL